MQKQHALELCDVKAGTEAAAGADHDDGLDRWVLVGSAAALKESTQHC